MTKKDLDFMLVDIGIHDFVLIEKEDVEFYDTNEIQESEKVILTKKYIEELKNQT